MEVPMKKTLTKRTLISLMNDIQKWVETYSFYSSDYRFFMTKNKYPDDEKFDGIAIIDIGEEYADRFYFGLAFDGYVYEALHCMESYYESAYNDFFAIIQKHGLAYDFLDSIHLIIYVDD